MKRIWHYGVIIALSVLVTACAGRKGLAPPYQGVSLPPIPISVSLPPDSPIDASEVTVTRLTAAQAYSRERAPSDLPSEFAFIEGFVIEPVSTVLPSPARVRLEPEMELPTGTTLFLFWIGSSRHATAIDRSTVASDGSVTFETTLFGFFIVAENTLLARPSNAFLVFGYADVIEGAIPLSAHFRAVAAGGNPPYDFTWNFDDGSEPASGHYVSHTFLDAGEYQVSVQATDSDGRVASGEFTSILATTEHSDLSSVNVNVFPSDPGDPLSQVFFPSVSGGVPPFRYAWDFGDGSTSSESDPEHRYPDFGIYAVHLQVTDAVLDEVQADLVLDLRRVMLTATPTFGSIPLEVTFDIQLEGADPDASATLTYGDGSSASVDPVAPVPVSHTYGETGTYTAQLEVTEGFGGQLLTARSLPISIVALPPPMPYVYAIHPAQAASGEVISLYGQDFGPYNEATSQVIFTQAVPAEVVEWNDSIVRVVVPDGAVDGDVYVARGIYESNRRFFNIIEPGSLQPPVIALISPERGPPGTQVTVLGANFGDTKLPNDRVMLNYFDLQVVSWSDNEIVAVIPPSAEDGNIVVYHQDFASNGVFFDVGIYPTYPPPVIMSISPTTGSPGDSVVIDGVLFGDPATDSYVLIGTTPMFVLLWSDTEIIASVPFNAGDGGIRVLRGGYFSNAFTFKVIPAPPSIGGLQQL